MKFGKYLINPEFKKDEYNDYCFDVYPGGIPEKKLDALTYKAKRDCGSEKIKIDRIYIERMICDIGDGETINDHTINMEYHEENNPAVRKCVFVGLFIYSDYEDILTSLIDGKYKEDKKEPNYSGMFEFYVESAAEYFGIDKPTIEIADPMTFDYEEPVVRSSADKKTIYINQAIAEDDENTEKIEFYLVKEMRRHYYDAENGKYYLGGCEQHMKMLSDLEENHPEHKFNLECDADAFALAWMDFHGDYFDWDDDRAVEHEIMKRTADREKLYNMYQVFYECLIRDKHDYYRY